MRVLATAKIKTVAPDPSHKYRLIKFLRAFRDWTQYVVDEIWLDKRMPSIRELHYRFYRLLREQGFRAHHCHKIEHRAREVVKAVKKNKGSKPVLRKLTARLDRWDYRLNLNNRVLRIAVLENEWIELKLQWYSYLDKYFNSEWKLKEILVSSRNGEVWVYFTFEKEVIMKKPQYVMGIDINFNNITYTIVDMNGKLVSMGTIPFNGLKRALSHKIISEKVQKKYGRRWRYVKGIREAIKKHGVRARNILVDSCHHISRKIVKIARKYNATIVLENLDKLRNRVNGSKKYNKRLSLWTYHRIQSYIYYKALIEGLPVIYVNPKGTSRTSPLGGKLVFINYKWVKLPNGHVVTRDIIASWNLALRGLSLLTRDVGSRGFVDSLKAPNHMQTQEGMRGKPVPELILSIPSS